MMKTITTERMNTVAGFVARHRRAKGQILSLVAIMLALLPATSYSADKYWTGSSSSNWGTSANWNPSGAPVGTTTVIFNGTGANYSGIGLGSPRALRAMTVTAGQTNAVTIIASTNATLSFQYSGNVLTVAAGNHKIVGTGTGSSGADCDVSFSNGTNTFDIASGASFEIQGRIGKGDTDNVYKKVGGGTLILSGNSGGGSAWLFANGGFHVQEGAVRFAVANAAGNSGNNFFVSSGAAIEVSNSSSHNVATGTWTLNGTGVSSNGALRSVSGTNMLTSSGSGTIRLSSASSIGVDSGSLLTISRVISGANDLTKVGSGTLLLSATNTYTGATIVEAGTLAFGKTNAISASSLITLSGGTIEVGTYSNALSNMTLTEDSVIALGDGTGTLSFAGGTGTWNGTLSLTGTLGEKTLRFGVDANGLTAEQQAMIKVNGYSTRLDAEGYVVILRGTVLILF